MKTSIAVAVLAAGLILAACQDDLVQGDREHTATLTADRSAAAVGDSIEFFLQGEGVLLAGLAIEFGDGAADTLSAEGAVTAGMRRKHAYSEAGTYEVVGTVVDATSLGLEEKKDTVFVQITDG